THKPAQSRATTPTTKYSRTPSRISRKASLEAFTPVHEVHTPSSFLTTHCTQQFHSLGSPKPSKSQLHTHFTLAPTKECKMSTTTSHHAFTRIAHRLKPYSLYENY